MQRISTFVKDWETAVRIASGYAHRNGAYQEENGGYRVSWEVRPLPEAK